jgi:hypothetical protein
MLEYRLRTLETCFHACLGVCGGGGPAVCMALNAKILMRAVNPAAEASEVVSFLQGAGDFDNECYKECINECLAVIHNYRYCSPGCYEKCFAGPEKKMQVEAPSDHSTLSTSGQ